MRTPGDVSGRCQRAGHGPERACSRAGIRQLVVTILETSSWVPQSAEPPSERWQCSGDTLINSSRLMNDVLSLDWLFKKRFIEKKTALDFHLGYNNRHYCPRWYWGLPKPEKGGIRRNFWIPSGWVIPYYRKNELFWIQIRWFLPRAGEKHFVIPGSTVASFAIDNAKDATVIVENEWDAILLHQEAGDLVNIIALGSVYTRPDLYTHELILRSSVVLIALYSGDECLTGAREIWTWWKAHYPEALRAPIVGGKNPTEARAKGLDLRAWIQAALSGGAVRLAG